MSGSPRSGRQPFRHGPRTLRGRATLAFTAVAVLLTTILVAVVWLTVSRYLLLERERSTLAQTRANAGQVQRTGLTPGLTSAQLLSQLPRENGSTSLLLHDGEWTTTSLQVGRDDLPPALRQSVLGGTPARQRITVHGEPMLAVGLPLSHIGDAYFEVFPLTELDNAYHLLSGVLIGAGIAVVPVSLLIGWWTTRPTFRPLERITTAAAAIAGGTWRPASTPGTTRHWSRSPNPSTPPWPPWRPGCAATPASRPTSATSCAVP